MGRNRTIPFGYEMKDGVLIPCHQEAAIVEEIFAQYRQGRSYLTIANGLSEQAVRYHKETAKWNKHMVKRILENKTYLGTDQYPRLISNGVFQAVREQQIQVTAGWTRRPVSIGHIKRKATCATCGSPIGTVSSVYKGSKNRLWHCSNPVCSATLRITDNEMEALVTALLGKVADEPELLLIPKENRTEGRSKQRQLYNGIDLQLEKPDFNEQGICTLILFCASERYKLCRNDADRLQDRELYQLLVNYGRVERFDPILFQRLADAVLIDSTHIGLRLTNGRQIVPLHREDMICSR